MLTEDSFFSQPHAGCSLGMTGVLKGSRAYQWPIWFLDAQVVKCALSHAGGSFGGFSGETQEQRGWLCSDSSLNAGGMNSRLWGGPKSYTALLL